MLAGPHFANTRPMPRLRPYAPKDWSPFIALELETQLDSLGDSTEEERQIFKERFIALLDVKMGFTKSGFRRPGAQLWVLEGDDGRFLGHLWLSDSRSRPSGSSARSAARTTAGSSCRKPSRKRRTAASR